MLLSRHRYESIIIIEITDIGYARYSGALSGSARDGVKDADTLARPRYAAARCRCLIFIMPAALRCCRAIR